MSGAAEDRADAAAFVKCDQDDRHHFRFIVAPKDAAEMTDLKAFTCDLVAQMERDLETWLEWVPVDHWNTDNPTSTCSCGASRRMAPTSSFPAITSATACGRGPTTWSGPSRNMRSVLRWSGRWKRTAGLTRDDPKSARVAPAQQGGCHRAERAPGPHEMLQ